MNTSEEARLRRIREANNYRQKKYRAMKKLREADDKNNLSKISSSDSTSDSRSAIAEPEIVLSISSTSSSSSTPPSPKDQRKSEITSEIRKSIPLTATRMKNSSTPKVPIRRVPTQTSSSSSTSSSSTSPDDQRKSVQLTATKRKLKCSTPKVPIRRVPTQTSSSSSSTSSDSESIKRRKLNESTKGISLQVLRTRSWSDTTDTDSDSENKPSNDSKSKKGEASTQTNNSPSVIEEEDTEFTMLKKIHSKLETIESDYKTVISMIKKVKAFQLTEKDFVIKYNLNIPFIKQCELDSFNSNLQLNEQFRNDFIAAMHPLIDDQQPLSRSLTDILRRYLSSSLTTKFTAVKKMPNKLLFKETAFFKCLQGVVCKIFVDRSTMRLVTEKKFIQNFSAAFVSSKS